MFTVEVIKPFRILRGTKHEREVPVGTKLRCVGQEWLVDYLRLKPIVYEDGSEDYIDRLLFTVWIDGAGWFVVEKCHVMPEGAERPPADLCADQPRGE
ncbi:MAG: hypothetical protein BWX98_01638 [Candidatus Aminicenantes bacterium ADurb.Bin147]|nr:MAG: hypothetical protein BWX98_01638 [Candidatus Aminicenantes bacterium ADurb.Bin147]